jgi:hypothetical protein
MNGQSYFCKLKPDHALCQLLPQSLSEPKIMMGKSVVARTRISVELNKIFVIAPLFVFAFSILSGQAQVSRSTRECFVGASLQWPHKFRPSGLGPGHIIQEVINAMTVWNTEPGVISLYYAGNGAVSQFAAAPGKAPCMTVFGCPPDGSDHNLNGFRDHGQPGRNLADMHLATHGLGPEHHDTAWLRVDEPITDHRVIFSRSTRYRNERFPWQRVWKAYRGAAAFVGTTEEHEDFCRRIGPVPFVPTNDLLAVARVIAGSRLFVGNQSCPSAIAEGLKKRMILEVFPALPNCCFERPERIEVWDDRIELPILTSM